MIRRVGDPKIPIRRAQTFQAMVHTVFTARGRGTGEILRREPGLFSSRSETQSWLRSRIDPRPYTSQLHTNDWIDLFQVTGSSLPHHRPISTIREVVNDLLNGKTEAGGVNPRKTEIHQ